MRRDALTLVRRRGFAPAAVLALAGVLGFALPRPRALPLRAPLASVTPVIAGLHGEDVKLSADDLAVLRLSSYLFRSFALDSVRKASVFVAYYASQVDAGMHSPELCIPGGGWNPVSSAPSTLHVRGVALPVHRLYIRKGADGAALVYYWYQGRGHVTGDQGESRLRAVRDAFAEHRTDESLVRVVVPLASAHTSESDVAAADRLARAMAEQMVVEVERVLPAAPDGRRL